METTELLIQINESKLIGTLIVDGLVGKRFFFSRNDGGGLIAWLEAQSTESVHVRLQVSRTSEMRMALELASMLARAGHTVSVGDVFLFSPTRPMTCERLNLRG